MNTKTRESPEAHTDRKASSAESYSALGLQRLIEESQLPPELKDLAKTYVRRASGRPKNGYPPGYGYSGQAIMAQAMSITTRALRKRLVRFDALAEAGASPIRIRRWSRARKGVGKRGGRSSDGYQIELVESYTPPDRSGTPVPHGSATEAELKGRLAATQEELEFRLPPDRSGTPVPMICVALTCEGEGSTKKDESAKAADGAPDAWASAPAAAEQKRQRLGFGWVQADELGPWDEVREPPELHYRRCVSDGVAHPEYARLAEAYGLAAAPRAAYVKAVKEEARRAAQRAPEPPSEQSY